MMKERFRHSSVVGFFLVLMAVHWYKGHARSFRVSCRGLQRGERLMAHAESFSGRYSYCFALTCW